MLRFKEINFRKVSKIKLLNYTIICFILFMFFNNRDLFLSYQDEVINYNSARSYSETNNLKAVNSIAEQRSIKGGFNWYGPSYVLIYGNLAKVFGFSTSIFLYFNLCLFFINLWIINNFNFDKRKKQIFTSVFLMSYSSFSFIFTFYPEILIITITLTLLLFYSKIDDT